MLMSPGVSAAATCLLFLCLSVTAQPGDVTDPGTNGEQEIRKLTAVWEKAHAARDTETLRGLLDAGYVYTDATGTLQTRAEYLESVFKSPDISRVSKFATSNVVVRIVGATAIVTGESSWKGRARGQGQFLTSAYRFTDVWVRRNGRWKAAATQGTRVEGATVPESINKHLKGRSR